MEEALECLIGPTSRLEGLIGPTSRLEGLIGPTSRHEGLIGPTSRLEGLIGPTSRLEGLIDPTSRHEGLIGPTSRHGQVWENARLVRVSGVAVETMFNCLAVLSRVPLWYAVTVYRPVLLSVVVAGGISWNNLLYSL